MGGALNVESTVGHGSVFSFTLELPVGKTPQASLPQFAGFRSMSVLVVDDMEANLIVAKGLLTSLGHRTRTAASGTEAASPGMFTRMEVVDPPYWAP